MDCYVVYYFGSHTFSVEVVDDRGGHSWARITVNILPDIVPIDFMPGTCKDPINRNRKGIIKVAIPGTAGMDVGDIDASTVGLYVWDFNERLSPINVRLLDITSPVIPWDECGCESKADGIDDLLLTFWAEDVAQLFNEVAANQRVSVSLWGFFRNGQPFQGADCVKIVGDGATAEESLHLPAQSDHLDSWRHTR